MRTGASRAVSAPSTWPSTSFATPGWSGWSQLPIRSTATVRPSTTPPTPGHGERSKWSSTYEERSAVEQAVGDPSGLADPARRGAPDLPNGGGRAVSRRGFVLDVARSTPPILSHHGEGFRREKLRAGGGVVSPAEPVKPLTDPGAAIRH